MSNSRYLTVNGRVLQRQQIGNFYDSETGQKMMASKEGLAQIESEISMQWSSELYKSVIHKLAENGYSLN